MKAEEQQQWVKYWPNGTIYSC